EVLEIKMSVNRRRGDVRVAEQFLHAAQFLTGFKQMRGERVPEHVRVDVHVQALLARPIRYPRLYGTRPDALAVAAHEERVLTDVRNHGPLTQPCVERLESLAAHRNDAFFLALALDEHGLIREQV